MKNEKKSYKVEIFGDHYSLLSDESEEHINESVALVNKLMKELAEKLGAHDLKKIAVLAALRIASEKLHLDYVNQAHSKKESTLVYYVEQMLRSS